jgi:L-fucose mutarotase
MGLLKGIHPLLTADLLYVLRSMGHGDKLAVVDCNFPAASVASKTSSGKCIILTVPLPEALSAICSVLPLDLFVEYPVFSMSPSVGMDLPPAGVEVLAGIHAVISQHTTRKIQPLERFAFYEEAKGCYAIIQTLERRLYGNVILQKGVVGPDGNDLQP